MFRTSLLILTMILTSVGVMPSASRTAIAQSMVSNASSYAGNSYSLYLPVIAKNYCNADYFDDFSENRGWPIRENSAVRYGLINGQYQILMKVAGQLGYATAPACSLENYSVEVDVNWMQTTSNAIGLMFGDTYPEGGFINSYIFVISTQSQTFTLYRNVPGSTTTLAHDVLPNIIYTGVQVNKLKAIRSGTTITLFINDTVLGYVDDNTVSGLSKVALATISFTGNPVNTDARFDSLKIVGIPTGGASLNNSEGRQLFVQTINQGQPIWGMTYQP